MRAKLLRLTERGQQVSQEDLRLLKVVDYLEDGVFEYYDVRDLRDKGLELKDVLDLKREGLIEEVKPTRERSWQDTLDDWDVEQEVKEAHEDLRYFELTHPKEPPPIPLLRRFNEAFKEYRRRSSSNMFF